MLNTNFTALVNNTNYIAPIALPRTFSKESIVKSVVAAINHPFTNSFLFFAGRGMLPPPLFYACIGCVSIGAFIRSKEDSVVGSIFSVVDHPFIKTGILDLTFSYFSVYDIHRITFSYVSINIQLVILGALMGGAIAFLPTHE
jgi:hypothetical protein